MAKTENLFEKLNEALKMTVKTDSTAWTSSNTYRTLLTKRQHCLLILLWRNTGCFCLINGKKTAKWALSGFLDICNTSSWRRLQLETKISKTQNENICLIYLNTEMNGNYHFLSFCALFLKVQNQVLWTSLSFQQSGWKNGFSWMIVHEKWAFQVALFSIFGENTHVFQTFSG